MRIGERLSSFRKKKGYTQKDLAEKLNVSQQVISNIERDTTTPDINLLNAVADLYQMSLDELVGRNVNLNPVDNLEYRIMSIIEHMDEEGKELSLELVNQVALHQGNKNAK